MLSKRESLPLSEEMREKRYVPTAVCQHLAYKRLKDVRLVAQIPMAALSSACLHHHVPCPKPVELKY